MSTDGGTTIAGTTSTASTAGQTGQAGQTGTTVTDWTTGMSDDVKGYVQNKGFKDPTSVIDSYRNLEKLMGAPRERILKLPDKDDAPEWNDIYSRLGKPTDPKEYKFDLPQELFPEADTNFARQAFHEIGMSKRQAETLMTKWRAHAETQSEATKAQYAEKMQNEAAALRKEWGAAYNQNLNAAKSAAHALGISPESIDKFESVMGGNDVIKMLFNVRGKMAESNFVSSDTRQTNMNILSPEAARNKIAALKMDSNFTGKLMSHDISAREEWSRLHSWAYPDQN